MKKISILGGDLRNVELAKMYAKENVEVYTYGLECEISSNNAYNSEIINNAEEKNTMGEQVKRCATLNECLESSECIFSAIPLSKNGEHINAPYSSKKITLKEVIPKISNKIFVGGSINNEIEKVLIENKNKVIDLMKNETLTIYNAIATAEGAISKIISNTNVTIYKSNILILGYGRIGKILASRLNSFGAKIFCEARKEKDLAWINTNGYNPVNLNELSTIIEKNKFDIIINTVPSLILKREILEKLGKKTYILDLASKSGGVDMEYAKKAGLNVETYLGVPGKIASRTMAEFIKKSFEKM